MRISELRGSSLGGRTTEILRRMVEVQRLISDKLGETKAGHGSVKPARPERMLTQLLQNTDHQLDLPDGLCSLDMLPPVLTCPRCKQRSSRCRAARWLTAGSCPALS